MRLGFVTGRWATVSKEEIWTDAGLGRLIDALHDRAGELTAAVSIFEARHALHDHRLAIPAARLVPLPAMKSFVDGALRHVDCRRAIAEVERRSDVVVVQIPFTTPTALIEQRVPRVYHLCADIVGVVQESGHYRGLKRTAALSTALAVQALYRRLIRRPSARVVAHGESLLARYPGRGRSTVSSSLSAQEIMSVPRRRGLTGPLRILFVGHLRPEKGFDILVDAFERIRRELPAELLVIGPENVSQQEVVDRLRTRLEPLLRDGAAQLLGPKGFGPELFQHYADADVLALPSFSEGTPRVLLEARAFGCPVVASNVGGIPSSVIHEIDGLLVPSGDPRALAAALLRIARDAALRQRLIKAGIERARRHTVEAFADEIYQEALALTR